MAEYISACFTGLWIESHEHDDALAEIAQMCREQKWRLATWDIERGLQIPGQPTASLPMPAATDPLAAIRSLNALAITGRLGPAGAGELPPLPELGRDRPGPGPADHRRQAEPHVHRDPLARGADSQSELEKLFVVVEHDLPDREQLEEIARGIATEDGELPEGDDLGTVLDAAAGLTRYEAEGAFSLSLVRHQRIEPEAIWELKSGMLKKSGLLTLHRGGERFADLGGLDNLKAFCMRSLRHQGQRDPVAGPRASCCFRLPAAGRSPVLQGLGNEIGRPTLILDVGSLMGSLVGQTEANIRQALRIADAMSPCILMCDEVEKALSGVAVQRLNRQRRHARLFGTLLTWLNDRTSDVYVVCTCNDIAKLPPEFSGPSDSTACSSSSCPASSRRTGNLEHLPRDVRAGPPAAEAGG